jgi:HSP20 family protein
MTQSSPWLDTGWTTSALCSVIFVSTGKGSSFLILYITMNYNIFKKFYNFFMKFDKVGTVCASISVEKPRTGAKFRTAIGQSGANKEPVGSRRPEPLGKCIKETAMKAMTLYRPVTIDKALNDFDRYMEAFFGESPLTPALNREPADYREPIVDIRETSDAYFLEAELPGYDEKTIEVQMDGSVLTIASKKEENTERNVNEDAGKNERRWVIRERRSASFSRSFKLPENADPENISARFKNGLLSLEIKKPAEAKKRIIQINDK